MRICIDSNQFIFGLVGSDPACERLLQLLPRLDVVVPRLVVREVDRNLSLEQANSFHALLAGAARVQVIDEPVPSELVGKYTALGLREKADAFIGAFAEWQQARWLLSENRHFLHELRQAPFEVIRAHEFLRRHYPMAP